MQQGIATDRRKWRRENTRIPARYFIKDGSTRFQDCTMISISRGGAAVLLPGHEFVKDKTPFYLDFILPKTLQQFSVRGLVRMEQNRRGTLVIGIQFDKLLPENIFNKLIDAEPLRGWLSGIHERLGQTATAVTNTGGA